MKRGVLWMVGAALIPFLLAGCGGQTTPDTEGQTLTQARQALSDAGVPERNITVTGEKGGDPNTLIVCDHDPDNVAPTQPTKLDVAANCPDDPDKKKKKKSSNSSGKSGSGSKSRR